MPELLTQQPQAHEHRPGWRADIQGWRAIAVLLVIGYHLGWPRGGYLGVDLFFVISGYVIAGKLAREGRPGRVADWRRFLAGRVRRLYPAAMATVAVTCLAAVALAPPDQLRATAKVGVAAVFISANEWLARTAVDYFDTGAAVVPLLHLWSLAVEEQFYLLFPAVWWGARRARARWRFAPAVVLGLVVAVSLAWWLRAGVAAVGLQIGAERHYYATVGRVWAFGLGVGAEAVSRRSQRGPLTNAGFVLGAIGTIAGVAMGAPATVVPSVVASAGLAAVLAAGPAVAPARLLSGRLLSWIGDRSYSLYLWSWPFTVFAVALRLPLAGRIAVAALSVVPAAWSRTHLEERFRHGGRSAVRVGGTSAAIALAACASVLVVGVPTIARVPGVRSFRAETAKPSLTRAGCTGAMQLPRHLACGDPADARPVVLFGDSNALQFVSPFLAEARRTRQPAAAFIKRGCAPTWGMAAPATTPDPSCARLMASATRDIARLRPAVVVVAMASDGYLARGLVPTGAGSATDRWGDLLERLLRRVGGGDTRVILVTPIPKFDEDQQRCAGVLLALAPSRCGDSRPAPGLGPPAHREVSLAVDRAVAADVGATLVDLEPVLCPDDVCRTYRDGSWWWRDGEHVSESRALALRPAFARMLASGPR